MGEEHDSITWQLPLEQEMEMLKREKSKRKRKVIVGALHKEQEEEIMDFGLCRAPMGKPEKREREKEKGSKKETSEERRTR